MCYNCGCHNALDDMGMKDTITEQTFTHLAHHWNKTLKETKAKVFMQLEKNKIQDAHLIEMFEKAAKAWGQSVTDAKKQTYQMLKNELKQ